MNIRGILGLVVVMVLMGIGFIFAYTNLIPNQGHGGDNVYIFVNGKSIILQNAINDGDFGDEFYGGGSYVSDVLIGHRGEEIIVNVGGEVKTLQAAINDESLCGTEAETSPSIFDDSYGNTAEEVLVTNSSGSEKTLQEMINAGEFYQCLPGPCFGPAEHASGYELVSFGVYATCRYTVPWDYVVEDSNVIGSSGNLVYSTTQGDRLPANTYGTGLRLNINGERAVYCGDHPQSYLRAVYRIWGNSNVSVNTQSWAEGGCRTGTKYSKLSRTDTFERQDSTTILVNGISRTIDAGASYDVQRVTWNPGDHGSGESYVRVINDACTDYFDVVSYVAEVDEQCDSSKVWIEGYIESA